MTFSADDTTFMRRAIALSRRGEGLVEPNPMVGCVLVADGKVIGEGWHEKFGGPHAEVNAVRNANDGGNSVEGSTAYVTLEPCSHHGKTPPCCQALIEAKVGRVVIAVEDPNPQVAGQGIVALREASMATDVGLLTDEAGDVLAPYLKRLRTGKPWIVAKWAMTIDGKIATSTLDSQWISNEASRGIVHQIRGRVDAIMVGSGTALADNPMLTARPAGARIATRVVFDYSGRLAADSQLVQSARETPVLVARGPNVATESNDVLAAAGCDVWVSDQPDRQAALSDLLTEMASRDMTNVLVEGGAGLLGLLQDVRQIDEVHAFIGPKLIGGAAALSPIGGIGHERMADADAFRLVSAASIQQDVYVQWRREHIIT